MEAIQEPMKLLSKKYNINRARRCYVSLIYYLSSEEGSKVIVDHYDLYILAALIIYSKKYGDGAFSYIEAVKLEFSQETTYSLNYLRMIVKLSRSR